MTEPEEEAYLQGQRTVWVQLLKQCCMELGYADDAASRAAWIYEREQTVAMLRQVCADHGDNEWEPENFLPDVVEKHLHRHLEELIPCEGGDCEHVLRARRIVGKFAPGEFGLLNQLVEEFHDVERIAQGRE